MAAADLIRRGYCIGANAHDQDGKVCGDGPPVVLLEPVWPPGRAPEVLKGGAQEAGWVPMGWDIYAQPFCGPTSDYEWTLSVVATPIGVPS
jgi:hypothetical protein